MAVECKLSFGEVVVAKIMKALSRAISHELQKPGELTSYLEYLHILASSREVDKQQYQEKIRNKKLKDFPKEVVGFTSGDYVNGS